MISKTHLWLMSITFWLIVLILVSNVNTNIRTVVASSMAIMIFVSCIKERIRDWRILKLLLALSVSSMCLSAQIGLREGTINEYFGLLLSITSVITMLGFLVKAYLSMPSIVARLRNK